MPGHEGTTGHREEGSVRNLEWISKLLNLMDLLGILESSFASRIKELNQMSAAHVANLINSIIPTRNITINHLPFGGLTS